jgi:ribosomal-protein-alanine N-acetyltransferase
VIRMVTPLHLAMLHRAAFTQDRAWDADEFANLLATPHCHVIAESNGFALIRVIADEAELLTIAVHPEHRRAGLGKSLLIRSMAKATDLGAFELFLEVAADNAGAMALYHSTGFAQVGLRPGYYARAGVDPVDALLLSRPLP